MLLVAHRTPPTAAGCAQLVAAGAGAFELDVQLAGGEVLVSHYLPFLRVRGWLQHDSWRFRWRSGPPHDAVVRDAVDRIPADCLILLDPKDTDAFRRAALVDALARTLGAADRFRVSTHRPDDLARYRDAGFRTWRTIKDGRDLHRVITGAQLPDDGVSVRHTLLTSASVDRLREVTGRVVAWTVNDVIRAAELAALGVDGITTDRLDVMRAVAGP
ncbi:MAG TPA: glycerophosphodiester phosphodiesterase [Jatrophihabitans sp.]|jgi:glycerophosphoryl diester phosphodiesterase|nr:glycerophosphodiester phosphodiesterase [Jatrophihabitans sp.]